MTKTRRHGFPARTARSASDLGRIALSFRRQFCPDLTDDEAFHGIDVFEQLCNRSVMFKGQRILIDTDVMPLPRSVEAVTFFDARNEEFRMCLSETTYVDGRCARAVHVLARARPSLLPSP